MTIVQGISMRLEYLILATILCAATFNTYADSNVDGKELNRSNINVQKLTKMAKNGDAPSQYELGALYKNGDLVPKNLEIAVYWLQKASEQGHGTAQYILGMMYKSGQGVDADPEKYVELMFNSAKAGFSLAAQEVGYLYANGDLIQQDIVASAKWFQLAAVQGLAESQQMLGLLYSVGLGVPEDKQASAYWTELAAKQGVEDSQLRIGAAYISGIGVEKNLPKGLYWFQQAASKDNAEALYFLGKFHQDNKSLTHAECFELFIRAASQGHKQAQAYVGIYYLAGDGIVQNDMLAYVWLTLAAAQGDSKARQLREVAFDDKLSSEQKSEAQRIASTWKLGDRLDGKMSAKSANSSPRKISTGTAFIVSKVGHVVTNHHVISGCSEVRVVGKKDPAEVITSDSVNDIALLKISEKSHLYASLHPDSSKLQQGEDIIVYGYPLNSLLSSGGNLTPGVISAVSGLGNNTNQIQITAPIQPGSSGSPVMDNRGLIVGVVSMKLDDKKAAQSMGSIPQNVNFAVNGLTLKAFLDANDVPYRMGKTTAQEKRKTAIAEDAKKWTLLLECWN